MEMPRVYNLTDTSAYPVLEGGTNQIVDLSNVNWSQLSNLVPEQTGH